VQLLALLAQHPQVGLEEVAARGALQLLACGDELGDLLLRVPTELLVAHAQAVRLGEQVLDELRRLRVAGRRHGTSLPLTRARVD